MSSQTPNLSPKITIEDILIWTTIFASIALIIWTLFGSPTEIAALFSLVGICIFQIIVIWKKLFSIESKTTIGFHKVKTDISIFKNQMQTSLIDLKQDLSQIKTKLKI